MPLRFALGVGVAERDDLSARADGGGDDGGAHPAFGVGHRAVLGHLVGPVILVAQADAAAVLLKEASQGLLILPEAEG